MYICELCGDEFQGNGRQKKRCPKVHERSCTHCGKPFTMRSTMSVKREHCSRECQLLSQKKTKPCPICGTEFWKASATCSRSCANELRRRTDATFIGECAACGKTTKGRVKYCDRDHYRTCEVCKKDFVVDPRAKKRTCSSLCSGQLVNSPESMEKRKATSRERYGTNFPQQAEEVKVKMEATHMERYGVKSPLASAELRAKGFKTSKERYGHEWYAASEEGKAARAKTNMERYGAENPFASEEVKKRIEAVMLERYGVVSPLKHKDILERVKATNLERYGFENVLQVPEIQDKAKATLEKNINSGAVKSRRVSKINEAFAEVAKEELGAAVTFEAPIGRFSIDMKLEVAGFEPIYVDLHPTVSHNLHRSFYCLINKCPADCDKHKHVNKSYHYKRAQAALEADVRLIQWYGWESEAELISFLGQKLLPARKLSARKLKLARVTQSDANRFLQQYHSQGAAKKQTHCYGLVLNDELVAVATFGPSRFSKLAPMEFIRYATKRGYVIHGGAGRLFEAFKADATPETVMSYVDFNHTTKQHTFLHSMGFEERKPTGPNVIWHSLEADKQFTQSAIVKLGADRLLGTSYGSREEAGVGNKEIMLLEGYLPVATAGNRILVWES